MNIIKAQNLEAFSDKIEHGFFGKQGGVSEGIYASLNCGIGSDDVAENVQENRRLVAAYFGQEVSHLYSVHQVHSAECQIVIHGLPVSAQDRPKADAMVTDAPNQILGILTADCTPVVFTGKKQDGAMVIGAAHAGWRGAVGGILQNTVNKMVLIGAEIDSIHAAIGPCIGPKSYEVGEDFAAPFLAQGEANEHFFKSAQKEGHLMFDLPGYIANQLAGIGVLHVTITGHDTYGLDDEYFSYRRKTHKNEPDYGRQISAIMIKG